MSKATDDLIDRIQGAATALRGVKTKLSPPGAPPSDVPPAAPPPQIEQEDYNHAKQVIADLKAQVEALEATVAKDSKVPGPMGANPAPPPAAEPSPQHSESTHKEGAGSHKAK